MHACALQSLRPLRSLFVFFFLTIRRPRRSQAQTARWKMAAKLEPLKMEPSEVVEEAEEAEGREGEPASPWPGQKGGSLVPLQ